MATNIKNNVEEEHIRPAEIADDKTGKKYVLDFSRESVKFAEGRGFEIENVFRFPATYFPELFYLAFRKNYPNIARSKTDEFYNRLGGFSGQFLERLVLLYNQAAQSNNVVKSTEEMGKNGQMTVEL